MSHTSALVLLLCIAGATATESSWNGLRVTWSSTDPANAFFDLPKTAGDAVGEGWVSAGDADVDVYCLENDPRVCVLYDPNGVVAGVDVCIPVADVADIAVPYDFKAQDVFVQIERFNQPCYRLRAYFVSQEERAAGRRTWQNGVGSGIWIDSKSGRFELPIHQKDIKAGTPFTLQNCVGAMGYHYYYNLTEKMECSQFQPYFLLSTPDVEAVHGIGFQTFGTISTLNRPWFESIPYTGIKLIAPTSPECLTDWVKEAGLISIHFFFRDNPLAIAC